MKRYTKEDFKYEAIDFATGEVIATCDDPMEIYQLAEAKNGDKPFITRTVMPGDDLITFY